jgi:hypothetical protein
MGLWAAYNRLLTAQPLLTKALTVSRTIYLVLCNRD